MFGWCSKNAFSGRAREKKVRGREREKNTDERAVFWRLNSSDRILKENTGYIVSEYGFIILKMDVQGLTEVDGSAEENNK